MATPTRQCPGPCVVVRGAPSPTGSKQVFVAALLEAKARNIGVLEAEAATNASMIHEFVEAAVRGERPTLGQVRTDPPAAGTERSVGLLDETLDSAGPRPPRPRRRRRSARTHRPHRQQEQAG